MNQDIGAVLKGGPVMLALFLCAVVAGAVLIERLITIGLRRRDDAALFADVEKLIADGQTEEARALCERTPGQTAALLASGLRSPEPGVTDVQRHLEEHALAQIAALRQRLGVLDTVVTLAPLLGLLGTVTGMIRAFHIVGARGIDAPTVVTGGVAEALIATAAGLGIAIVVLPGYNFLSERVKEDAGAMEYRATQLLNVLARRHAQQKSAAPARGGSVPEPPRKVRRTGRALKLPSAQMRKARIEIIPMIDTIFFLLVFFMISSLSMVHMDAHKVALPSSATAALRPSDKIVVTISKEGDFYVDRAKVDESRIRPLVAARVNENPDVAVIINCDRTQRLDLFDEAFDLIKQANAGNVMIATAPEGGQTP